MAVAAPRRSPLTRARILRTALDVADARGLDAVSMRRLAEELAVVPMALYKHVAGKEELLDGLVELLVGEIEETARASRPEATDWRTQVRHRVLAARTVLRTHPWARRLLESRTTTTPAVLGYVDATIGLFRAGGFSDDLTHHVMHALGSRAWGFTQELFDDPGSRPPTSRTGPPPTPDADTLRALASAFPNVAAVARVAVHDDGTVVGRGCDDQAEFELALDLLLDGFARLHAQGWSSADAGTGGGEPPA